MPFLDRPKTRPTSRRLARPRAARLARPMLEAMEGRHLLSTMIPALGGGSGGLNGTVGGVVYHFQDDGKWSNLGNSNVTSLVDTHDPLGREELFARRADGSIWSYTFAEGAWSNTGGHLDSMSAGTIGIIGTAGGMLFHYQDDQGWVYTGGHNVASVVESRNPLGQEELFARLTDDSIWSYNMVSGTWAATGRVMSRLTANVSGVFGITAEGYLWHYQDNTGWTYTGGVNIDTVVESRNPLGQEEMFARTRSGEVWSYTTGLGAWSNTGGHLDTMIANVSGVSGTSNGLLFHYQDNTGWYYTNQSGVASVVDSHNQFKQEEMFVRHGDGTIWELNTATNTWQGLAPRLD